MVLSVSLLSGCPVAIVEAQPDVPEPELLAYDSDCLLHEHHYMSYGPITLAGESSDLKIELNLRTWDGDYKLELLFMTEANFTDFQATFGVYEADRTSLSITGITTWDLTVVPPGVYYFVVDNSDEGWEETDLDGEDDAALFDFVIYKMP